MFCRSFLLFTLLLLGPPTSAARVDDQASARPEVSALAEGWALLAKGDAAGASVIAEQQLAREQNNAAALVLAVDANLARGGALGGLGTYEKWLGAKRLDDAYVLRRVARKLLLESTKQTSASARLEALKQLAADGDLEASATLEQAAASNGLGEARALAVIGNEKAVDQLIAQLGSVPDGKARIIEALGQSGSQRAIPPVMSMLSDANDVNRAAAAEALGRLGATQSIARLRPLLQDPVFTVKLRAAGALLRLSDSSGYAFLQDLTRSEHAGVRIGAAEELASQPDASWQTLVRNLTTDTDPVVRLQAARLIARYDLALANSVLDALARDENVGIREAASEVLIDHVAASFAQLRGLLRSGDVLVRVKAAGRILELSR